MSTPESAGTIGKHVRNLRIAIAARAESETRMAEKYNDAVKTHAENSRQLVVALQEEFAVQQAKSHRVYEDSREEANRRHATEYNAVSAAYRQTILQIDRKHEATTESVQSEMENALWMVTSVLDDDSEDSPKRRLKTLKSQLSLINKQLHCEFNNLQQLQQDVTEILTRRRQGWIVEGDPPSSAEQPADWEDAYNRLQSAADSVRQTLTKLKNRVLSRIMSGWNVILLLFLIWGGFSGGLFFAIDPTAVHVHLPQDPTAWGLLVALLGLVPTVFTGVGMYSLNRSHGLSLLRERQAAMRTLSDAFQHWRTFAREELDGEIRSYKRWQKEFSADRTNVLSRIESRNAEKIDDNQRRSLLARREADAKFTAKLDAILHRRDAEIAEIDAHYAKTTASLASSHDREIADVTADQERIQVRRQAEEERERAATEIAWQAGLSRFTAAAAQHAADCSQSSHDWNVLADEKFKLPTAIPKAIQFGNYDCNLSQLSDGHLSDGQLSDGEPCDDRSLRDAAKFDVPAALRFPANGSLLYRTKGSGRAAAVQSMRAVMLRFLTSLPAGKVRLTVIDPVGLGEAFSAFMHLDDYDELMIGSRIWTEPGQIERQLSQLSEHMENVFQAYLRNEFETIDEYNQQAGEVAEPYHLLVVANFPTNFTETTARRLTNIATNGSRCGVYVLCSVDLTQTLPHKFRLADLEENATTLEWKRKRFVAAEAELKDLPLRLDAPPRAELFTRIVHSAGRQSQYARKVEVPFSRVAPQEDKLWTENSSKGVSIPLGRSGATKLQFLRLGTGTSQHVLIAGKTGSGKSSFLHAMITNLALHYSPDQIEFFLIDFKKGVEFKTYATHELPHARVIGIESDREFGVSVIERLDGILKERGDLFRNAGVQDLPGFRVAQPTQSLPRILLVIDEFQEFFVEDDALSQTASLLLDRLVRQGRAFGIHVLLGSQTLGGAYSLARSTLGQVAVRIALQCSESDAHLILSEENTAARLLTRPGEAIYNDANGLQSGNHPFQIAWLPDDEREALLRQLQARVQRDGLQIALPIVFEGNVASDPRRNRKIVRQIEAFPPTLSSSSNGAPPTLAQPRIWLGESVSIKAPTQIELQRHPGGNLLIVGQDGDAAFGLMATAFVTLSAQCSPTSFTADSAASQFYLLCGDAISTANLPERNVPETETTQGRLRDWCRLIEAVPHRLRLGGQREADDLIAELAHEVTRRMTDGCDDLEPPIFVFIDNLCRFRALRNDRDDFGFSMSDAEKPKSTNARFAEILNDGPAVGVHFFVCCDTCGNLNRWMTLATQRAFELRIAFRMNGTDSSNLIDSPTASRLGIFRAMLYRGDTGATEKFRPYAAPNSDWLKQIANHLHNRNIDLSAWDDVETLSVS